LLFYKISITKKHRTMNIKKTRKKHRDLNKLKWVLGWFLTLRLLMSYIYGAPSKARSANVVYI